MRLGKARAHPLGSWLRAGGRDVSGDQMMRAGEDDRASTPRLYLAQECKDLNGSNATRAAEGSEVEMPPARRHSPRRIGPREGHQDAATLANLLCSNEETIHDPFDFRSPQLVEGSSTSHSVEARRHDPGPSRGVMTIHPSIRSEELPDAIAHAGCGTVSDRLGKPQEAVAVKGSTLLRGEHEGHLRRRTGVDRASSQHATGVTKVRSTARAG